MASCTLTFDNLGEATELERGTWDGRVPIGQHASVTLALPRLLDELDELRLRATFFVEAINCELNRPAVVEIAARGHELGVHGWRHEPWAGLEPDTERELLDRCRDAFSELQLDPRAFRPPGGALTDLTPALLAARGYEWCSPARESVPAAGGESVSWRAFDWELVDAYHLMERFASLRARRGDSEQPLTATETEARLLSGLRDSEPGTMLVLHPALMLDQQWWQATRRILRFVGEAA